MAKSASLPTRRPGRTDPSLAVALGGGAARGLAHIPVLEAFDELGVRPQLIAGTSMGAILGACFAAGMSGADMRAYAIKLFQNRAELMRRLTLRWPGSLLSLWNPMTPAMFNAETLLEILLPESLPLAFEGLKVPFTVVATDFYEQEQVLFKQGPLMPAVAASSALPGLLKPVQIGERVLIDGGFVNPTPFDLLAGKADVVLAVDVTGNSVTRKKRKVPSTVDAWIGAAQITLHSIVVEKLKQQAPDILIRPQVTAFAALDFYKIKEILEASAPAKEETKRRLDRALRGKREPA